MWVAAAVLAGSVLARGGESVLTTGGLGLLEYRALLAQSLIQQIEEMKEESSEMRNQLENKEALLKDALEQLNQVRKEVLSLKADLASQEEEMERKDKLLAVFRRGQFEYYEVQRGDTVESIAANPMVYNDAARAVWIQQANSLEDDEVLKAGSVLVIPRYPDGTNYEL